jgi:hypothetical protein
LFRESWKGSGAAFVFAYAATPIKGFLDPEGF